MTFEEARLISDEMCRAFNTRNLDSLMALFSSSFTGHIGSGQYDSKLLIEWYPATWASFSDVQLEQDVISVTDETCSGRYSLSGTQDGVYAGKAPTGKSFEAWGVFIQKIENGKIAEVWGAFDDLGLRVQLGLVPDLG